MSREFSLRIMATLLLLAALHLLALPTSFITERAGATVHCLKKSTASRLVNSHLLPASPTVADSKIQESTGVCHKLTNPLVLTNSAWETSCLSGEIRSERINIEGSCQQAVPRWLLYQRLLI